MSQSSRPQVWIGPNRRAVLPGFLLCAALIAVGVALELELFGSHGMWLRIVGWNLIIAAIATLGFALPWIVRPRVAFQDDSLLIYMRMGPPLRVGVDAVEAFFQGTGPTMLPGDRPEVYKTANIVVRLADRAKDVHQRDVTPALGAWRDGYITIRGTFCEPITEDLLRQLNARLAEAKRQGKKSQVAR